MTVGLPGTGIGGLFYLLSSFAMPFAAAIRTFRDRRSQPKWRVALSQFAIGCTMFLVLAGTGLALDYFLSISATTIATYAPEIAERSQGFTLGVVPTFITFGLLLGMMILIEVAGAILIISDRRKNASPRRRAITKTREATG